MEYSHARGCVYGLEYHLVWSTKYRRKVLSERIGARLGDLLAERSHQYQTRFMEFNWEEDHVHLLVSTHPYLDIPKFVQSLKGGTARILFSEFPEIRSKLWKGHLWNPSFFITTVSETTETQIQRYIQNQRRR